MSYTPPEYDPLLDMHVLHVPREVPTNPRILRHLREYHRNVARSRGEIIPDDSDDDIDHVAPRASDAAHRSRSRRNVSESPPTDLHQPQRSRRNTREEAKESSKRTTGRHDKYQQEKAKEPSQSTPHPSASGSSASRVHGKAVRSNSHPHPKSSVTASGNASAGGSGSRHHGGTGGSHTHMSGSTDHSRVTASRSQHHASGSGSRSQQPTASRSTQTSAHSGGGTRGSASASRHHPSSADSPTAASRGGNSEDVRGNSSVRTNRNAEKERGKHSRRVRKFLGMHDKNRGDGSGRRS